MADSLTIWVPGKPVPKGSMSPGRNRHTGKLYCVDQQGAKLKTWDMCVRAAAYEAGPPREPIRGPFSLSATFVFPYLVRHYHTGKRAHHLREPIPLLHDRKPDLSKLIRAVEDALTGLIWVDDAQVAQIAAAKQWGRSPGASITVRAI